MAHCSNDLPSDLLDRIIPLLDTETDILRSGSLCHSWRNSAVCRARSLPAGHQVLSGNGSGTTDSIHLYKHSIHLVGGDPNEGGWLVKVADRHHAPVGKRILNPLSESPFRLDSLPWNFPSVLAMRQFRIKELHHVYVVHWDKSYRKAAVSWLDRSKEFVLLTIREYSYRLMKFDSVKQKWTQLADGSAFKDVIVHKGELLAVDITGRVVIVDKEDIDGTKGLIVAATGSPKLRAGNKYLVQSVDGELLLVEKYDHHDLFNPPIRKLRVYKLNEEEKTWVEVEDLGDNVLFLGNNSSFAVSSSYDLPNVRNCIFFTDYVPWTVVGLGKDAILDAFFGMFVFDFARKDVTQLTKCPSYSKMFWPPPAWLLIPAYDYDNID
ncbi:F-box protein SKIP23 [Linum grandiflorum]